MEIFEGRIVVKKILPSEKSTSEIDADFNLFITHFKLILENEKIIINTPKYFYILHKRIHVGTTITGTAYIPIGVLLLLWKTGNLLCSCPACGAKSYIIQAGGSALSGSHSYSAICAECSRCFCSRAGSFSEIYFPIFAKLKEFPNTQTISIKRTQKFSWSGGLVGQPTPDEIIEDGIHPIDLKDLVETLKGL